MTVAFFKFTHTATSFTQTHSRLPTVKVLIFNLDCNWWNKLLFELRNVGIAAPAAHLELGLYATEK